MHQQDVLVDQSLGDETAGEAGSAVGEDRLAVLGFQLRDFRRQVAARHIGLRPAPCTGLRSADCVLPAWARAASAAVVFSVPQDRRPLSREDGLGDLVHRRREHIGGGRPVGGHVMERCGCP